MAKFVTFIADPELEGEAIRAIGSINGELIARGVSISQIQEVEKNPEITLITARNMDYRGKQIVIDKSMSQSELIEIFSPKVKKRIEFDKGNSKVTSFVGTSGGVGTTSVAIEYAFEISQVKSVQLVDISNTNPDLAIALGLRRIDAQPEKIGKQLFASERIPYSVKTDEIVFDLGTNLASELLDISDQVFVVTRLGFNTFNRLQSLPLNPTAVLFNFAERSKVQQKWRAQILQEFPRMKCINIPLDLRAFELAGERRCALLEVASNSLARKSIATLAQCESM